MDEHAKISEQIRTIRTMSHMTQAEFALAVGVEQATVSRWERGAEPSLDNLRSIARLASNAGLRIEGFEILGGLDQEISSTHRKILYLGSLKNKQWSQLKISEAEPSVKTRALEKLRGFQYPIECEVAVSLDDEIFEPDYIYGCLVVLGQKFARPTVGSEGRLCLIESEDEIYFLGEPHFSGDEQTFNIVTKRRFFPQVTIRSTRRVVAIIA